MRHIRSWEKERNIELVPALAFTAFAGEKSAAKVRESGFQDCLTKPVGPSRLIAALVALRTEKT
jgi:CheY-like chemotaxis protein